MTRGNTRTDSLLDYAVAAGHMLVHGRHEFWDVHDPDRTVTIDLDGEPYSRLVLEVGEPAGVVDVVNAAVRDARPAAQAA